MEQQSSNDDEAAQTPVESRGVEALPLSDSDYPYKSDRPEKPFNDARGLVSPQLSDQHSHIGTISQSNCFAPVYARQHDKGDTYGESNPNLAPADPSSPMWLLYLKDAKERDQALTDSMKANTDSILVFTGLFSATVAAFIIEGYKQLTPDSGDTTVLLLSQISQQIAAASNGSQLPTLTPFPDSDTFRPPGSAVRINILWFLSLSLSLLCALGATLVQQWARRYLHEAQSALRAATPMSQGRIHAYLSMGIERFEVKTMTEALPALLHASLALFFAGLVEFLFPINTVVAWVNLVVFIVGFVAYIALTVLPFICLNSPYATPCTLLLSKAAQTFAAFVLAITGRFRYRTWSNVLADGFNRYSFWGRLPKWIRAATAPFTYPFMYGRGAVIFAVICLSVALERRRVEGRWKRRLHLLERAAKREPRLPSDVLQWTWTAVMDSEQDIQVFTDSFLGFFGETSSSTSGGIVDTLVAAKFGGRMASRLIGTTLAHSSFGTGNRRVEQAVVYLRAMHHFTSQDPTVSPLWPRILRPMLPPLDELSKDSNSDVTVYSILPNSGAADAHQFKDCFRHLVEMNVDSTSDKFTTPKFYSLGKLFYILTLVRRVLPHLRSASPDSLALLWKTFALIPQTLSDEDWDEEDLAQLTEDRIIGQELDALRPIILAEADAQGRKEPETLEDVTTSSAISPYTRLYGGLRPVRSWLDGIEVHRQEARKRALEQQHAGRMQRV